VDYDDDGILDFISGSYDPGDIYLFRGIGEGRYEAGESILDAEGVPLAHHPVELARYNAAVKAGEKGSIQDRVASFGSWPTPVDWDGDGDLDMLIGSFGGEVYLRRNDGTRRDPQWAAESIRVEADGAPLKVTCHAAPVAADWDGDGRFDLVVGSGDGSVAWYANSGPAGAPELGPRQVLVEAKAESKFWSQQLRHDEAVQPGVRAQICVVDYDLDGRLDLLVGDWSHVERLRDLGDAEREEFEAVVEELADAQKRLNGMDRESDELEKLKAEVTELTARKKTFLCADETAEKSVYGRPTHSYVWLFRRKASSGASRSSR